MKTTEQYIRKFGVPGSQEAESHLTYYRIPHVILELIDGLKNPYNITRIRCSKLIVDALDKVLNEICHQGLESEIKSFDGCYNIRPIRGHENKKIIIDGKEYDDYSTHSWGISVDINAKTNALETKGDMNPNIIKIFENNGFIWGGNFKRLDPQHFQASKKLLGFDE